MRLFTVLVGLATILSFVLQLGGLLGQSGEVLWAVTAFLAGLTLGLGLGMLSKGKGATGPVFQARQLLGFVLFSATGALVFVLFVLGVVLDDSVQRAAAQKTGSAVSGFLIFLLMFFIDSFFKDNRGIPQRTGQGDNAGG